MKVNPVKADPCELTPEWFVIYDGRVNEIKKVNRNEHNAPYSVSLGWGYDPSIRFIMDNTIPMKPVIDDRIQYAAATSLQKRNGGAGVVGWYPAILKWDVDPRLIKEILTPEKRGEWIGVIDTEDKDSRLFRATVGRYQGNYKYDNYGNVLADVDPKLSVATFCRAEGKCVIEPRDYDSDKNVLYIGELNNLLPNTEATLETLRSWGHKPFAFGFDEELRKLEKIIKVPVKTIT
jgi:hypothetical protein